MKTPIRKAYSKWGLPPLKQDNYAFGFTTVLGLLVFFLPAVLFVFWTVKNNNLPMEVVAVILLFPAIFAAIYMGSIHNYWCEEEEMEVREHAFISKLDPDEGLPQYVYRISERVLAKPRFMDYSEQEMRRVLYAILHSEIFDKRYSAFGDAIKAELRLL